jgi:hypothetical protein
LCIFKRYKEGASAPSPFFVDKLFKLTLSRNTLQINDLQRPNPRKPLIINGLCNVKAFLKKLFLSFLGLDSFCPTPYAMLNA